MPPRLHDYESTRASWNVATRHHNAHKGDQAARLRAGDDPLFPEELELLGPLEGVRVAHLQCNAGQDSLGLARRGARVTGVDLSDEAVEFARGLSRDSGIAAEFVRAELVDWLASTDERFDVAFSSYGACGWLPDLGAWARGVARVLRPGGRFVYVEFHPIVWSFDAECRPTRDDYFAEAPFTEPVRDYVAEAGPGLGAPVDATPGANEIPATSWQHGLGQVLDALARAGLVLEHVREYPFANGARVIPALVPADGRKFVWPPGTARLPLMFGVSALKPAHQKESSP